ncbi:MAG TPA: glycogen debranching N-terminal domain-containing protein, partial [Actinotalea sp.]
MRLQPLLHDLLVAVMAPTQAWSGRDGQLRSEGAQGVFHADTRVLSRAVLTVGQDEPEAVAGGPTGPGSVEVISLVRGVDGPGADPTARMCRRRTVTAGAVEESVELSSAMTEALTVPLALHLACDLARMDHVKAGDAGRPLPAVASRDGLRWAAGGEVVVVTLDGAHDPQVDLADPAGPVVRWTLTVPPRATVRVTWRVAVERSVDAVVDAPPPGRSWSVPDVTSDDRRLPGLLHRALDDLHTLRMSTPEAPDDVFLAAGAPWFFTLFGRDSLWAARMLLPLGTDLAGGTLRTLARRQGTVVD